MESNISGDNAASILNSVMDSTWLSNIIPDTVMTLPMYTVFAMMIALFTTLVIILYQLLRGRPLLAVLSGGLLGSGCRRDAVLLVGLPSSGKTCLFSALVRCPSPRNATAHNRATDCSTGAGGGLRTCTSMEPNVGVMHPAHGTHTRANNGAWARARLIDYPGHRRLRRGLTLYVASAHKIIVVVDAITVQDDQHEGAVALAELLLSVMQRAEFVGVRAVLVACTKRDEITSYTAQAVRVLTEKAVAAALQSYQGQLGSVDAVRDAKGRVIRGGGGGRRAALNVRWVCAWMSRVGLVLIASVCLCRLSMSVAATAMPRMLLRTRYSLWWTLFVPRCSVVAYARPTRAQLVKKVVAME